MIYDYEDDGRSGARGKQVNLIAVEFDLDQLSNFRSCEVWYLYFESVICQSLYSGAVL